ncbi:MAG: HlyD family efflux transporter periplasmic adaptor subunit [Prevotellaceae bacterium]|jgi:HlyD family secretion protein|nr:HlyD family efflux transporter periplasmic adaptor subunit [Prevotellaceae bacterium]
MKTVNLLITGMAVLALAACRGKNSGYDASGVFEATEITVSAKGNGEILRLDAAEGQCVEARTTLGVIDTMQLYLKKAQLQATIRAMNSRKLTVSRQIAALQEQIDKQKTEQRRFETLVRQNAATQKQLDDVVSGLATLEKQLAAQTETLNSSNSSLAGEQESLAVQIAQIDDLIRNSIIASPVKGTVIGKYAEAGEFAVQGRALFKVADLEVMYLRAYITSAQLTGLKIGQTVAVFSDWGESGRREYRGTVSWISDRAEFTPKTIQTRDERANLVYAVKIAVKNDGYIKKGMYGEVQLMIND